MRIHLNHPTPDTLLTEARKASGVTFDRYDRSGSRTHHDKYDIILSGESGRRTNQRWGFQEEGTEAATWDQWGIFLAVIFDADPTAMTPYYKNAEDFHWQTGGRFERCAQGDALVLSQDSPDYKITAHRWAYDHETSRPWSGEQHVYCKGHGVPKNKRAECHATRILGRRVEA